MRQRGFTLIELLIVVAIIGIISAIAAAHLTNAIDRGRQKATMTNIRSIATAIAAYEVDFNRYPADVGSMTELAASLIPHYITTLPRDGWGFALVVASDATGDTYTLLSQGKYNQADTDQARGGVHNFTDDIVMVDGQFVQWPEGLQQ